VTKKIFIAATGQQCGKTTTSISLLHMARKNHRRIGFIKPFGPKPTIFNGRWADMDAVLIARVYGLEADMECMSPVVLQPHSTRHLLEGKLSRQDMIDQIQEAADRIQRRCDFLVIEGAGHSGVGSVAGLSNPFVARLLDAPMLMVTGAGIGRVVDNVHLNYALCRQEGADLRLILVNKLLAQKRDATMKYLRLAFRDLPFRVAGGFNYSPILANPTLRHIATPEKNVVTVEDPIEMIHEDFNQIGVQPAVGVTFSTILRNILRQDPDIIMIGEMRDLETAQNAVQAALTGHLVLSTLHTNDAPSAIIRLLDLGVPPYLIQATLVGILAQRLVRRICLYCKEPFTMEASHLKDLGLESGLDGAVTLHRGTGCNRCRQTGYFGRLGIYEVMPFTEGIRRLTTADADAERIRRQALGEGMVTLRQSGIQRMLEGRTTYQEVLKATWDYL